MTCCICLLVASPRLETFSAACFPSSDRICFVQVTIVKPLTSRPANSERFFVCLGLKERNSPLASFLLEVNSKFSEAAAQRGAAEVNYL